MLAPSYFYSNCWLTCLSFEFLENLCFHKEVKANLFSRVGHIRSFIFDPNVDSTIERIPGFESMGIINQNINCSFPQCFDAIQFIVGWIIYVRHPTLWLRKYRLLIPKQKLPRIDSQCLELSWNQPQTLCLWIHASLIFVMAARWTHIILVFFQNLVLLLPVSSGGLCLPSPVIPILLLTSVGSSFILWKRRHWVSLVFGGTWIKNTNYVPQKISLCFAEWLLDALQCTGDLLPY